MTTDLTWVKEAGLDTQTGISYTGGEEKYLSALQRFHKNYEKNRARVEEFLATGDLENFMITVHALKSNAKMIGAMALSGDFETLEHASRDHDTGVINELTPKVLEDYASLIDRLKPVEEMGDVRPADEISGEVAGKIVTDLLEALDDFDDDLSKELAVKLSGYPFRMTQASRLKEAIAFIEDFMYDEAAEIIKEIAATIE